MRLLTTGFEMRTLNEFYASAISSWGGGRINGTSAFGDGVTFKLDGINTFYARFAYHTHTAGVGVYTRFRIRDSEGASLLHLTWGINNPITAYQFGSTTAIAQTSGSMQQLWYLFEVYFHYTDQVTGQPTFQLKQDGLTVISYNGATAQESETPFEGNLGFIDFGAGMDCYLDDIAVNDTSGATDNSWCGDGHVVALAPNGNGDSSQFVGSDGNSTDNYVLVDERPPNATDYVESETVGAFDLYHTTNITLKPADQVRRVWVEAVAREQSADADGIQLGIKPSGSLLWSPSQELGIDYKLYKSDDYFTNPATGQPWTQTDLNATQIGVRAS